MGLCIRMGIGIHSREPGGLGFLTSSVGSMDTDAVLVSEQDGVSVSVLYGYNLYVM